MKGLKVGSTTTVLTAMAVLASGNANANLISENFSSLGEQNTSGNITWNVATEAGSATLDFALAGYRSLDGFGKGYSDIFHLLVNGGEVFTGSFNLGGGGSNKILFNPNGGSAVTTTFGATDNPHSSSQATWSGGTAQISIPIDLIFGANQIDFRYSGYAQGLADEGWGINQATLRSNVPEPGIFALLAAGLFGLFASRRRIIK